MHFEWKNRLLHLLPERGMDRVIPNYMKLGTAVATGTQMSVNHTLLSA